jgi:hypothetical protein
MKLPCPKQISEFLTSNNYFIDNQQDNVTGRGNKNVPVLLTQ